MRTYLLLIFSILIGCQSNAKKTTNQTFMKKDINEVITLGGGCFWCTEAVFQRLKGVDTVIVGYMGGTAVNPTYEEVCTGLTGHAEVSQVHYNPDEITDKEILEVF